MRSGEEERAGAHVEKFDQVARAANITADGADGFAERTDLNVHPAVATGVVDGAATTRPEDAGGVRVINHHDAAVFFGEVAEGGQVGDVTVHGENTVGDEQFFAGPVFGFFEDAAAIGSVFVFENFDGGAREAAAVNDGGVVQRVGDDEIFFAEDGGHGAGVRGETGLEDDAGFDFFEGGDLLFEREVALHGAGDGAYGAGADAELAGGVDSGATKLRMRGEAEIIVGAEVDDFFAVEVGDGLLFAFENFEAVVEVGVFQVFESFVQVAKLRARRCCGHAASGNIFATRCGDETEAALGGALRFASEGKLARLSARIQKNFSSLAGFEQSEGGFEIIESDAFAEKRLEVEAIFFEQVGHLDPSFKHFAAVDTLDSRAFENDVIDEIEGDGIFRNTEQRSASAGTEHLETLVNCAGVSAHFEEHVGAGAGRWRRALA